MSPTSTELWPFYDFVVLFQLSDSLFELSGLFFLFSGVSGAAFGEIPCLSYLSCPPQLSIADLLLFITFSASTTKQLWLTSRWDASSLNSGLKVFLVRFVIVSPVVCEVHSNTSNQVAKLTYYATVPAFIYFVDRW